MGAAEFAGMTFEFCEENGLRYKAMLEIRRLRRQLTNVINFALEETGLDPVPLDSKMEPPDENQARLLRQIIVAGLGSHVAKRSEAPNAPKDSYETLEMKDPVFIHPTSVLFKLQPEFVIYQEIVETNKKYMQTIMAVEPEWLPRYAGAYCKIGEPLENPAPYYCKNSKIRKFNPKNSFFERF